MTIYSGLEVEVRIATSTADLTTATAIPYVTSVSWKINQGLKQVSKGLGMGRAKEVHEGLQEITGTMNRTYDETLIDGTNTLAVVFGADNTSTLTEYYLELTNTTTDSTYTFSGVRGDYAQDNPDEGFVTETITWAASTVSIST